MEYDLSEAKEILDLAFTRLQDLYLTTSALSPIRTYVPRNDVDMELWTFFCSIIDFQVPVIDWLIPMLKSLLREIEGKGQKFIDLVEDSNKAKEILSNFKWGDEKKGFSHRFIKIEDVLDLFIAMKKLLSDYSSLGALARTLYEDGVKRNAAEPISSVVKGLASKIRNMYPELLKRNKVIIPNPSRNSAMKRMSLFVRWMARPYPDLGLWNFIEPKHLVVSLDLGVMRTVNRAFGVLLRKMPTWGDVIRVTNIFRDVDSDDPAKYDYVFSRPAIMGYCREDSAKNRCYLCPLSDLCKSVQPLPETKGKPLTSEAERKILDKFLKAYGHQFDKITTEYPLGTRRADAVAHWKDCRWCVIEVEKKLNYTAIGQALMYRRLYKELKNLRPEAIIVCEKADLDLKNACEIDAGIRVIVP